jgi:hypothetical protein
MDAHGPWLFVVVSLIKSYGLNLLQTPSRTHARMRMTTLAFLQSPQINNANNVAVG